MKIAYKSELWRVVTKLNVKLSKTLDNFGVFGIIKYNLIKCDDGDGAI